jgi:diguanylate cyclase (GGDEF)-like protein/PAS domain S-box-containing protein
MKRSTAFFLRGKQILCAVLALLALTLLYVNSQAVDVQRHSRITNMLRQLKQADNRLDLDIYALRFGLLTHCDPVVQKSEQLRNTLAKLERELNGLPSKRRADIVGSLAAYAQTLERKQEEIERFKSSNATLRNSLHFFPVACASLQTKLAARAGTGGLFMQTEALKHKILLYHLSGDPAAEAPIRAMIARLDASYSACPPQAQKELDLLLAHAAAIVDHRKRVDSVMAKLMKMPSGAQNDRVFRAQEGQHLTALYRASIYRFFLYVAGIALAAYVGWTLLHLRRKSQALNRMNETLEQRITARTETLARMNAELSASEQRFRAIFNGAIVGVGRVCLTGQFLETNQALQTILGDSESEIQSKRLWDCTHPEDAEESRRLLAEVAAGTRDHFRAETRFLRPDGAVVWTHLTVSLVRDAQQEPLFLIALLEDITEHKQTEERIEHLANHDVLTGLPNRVLFQERLERALHAANRHEELVGVLFLDLDRFKIINDSLGHRIGDLLLQRVAERVRQCVRESDVVCRMGGDEFVVLLPRVSARSEVERVGRRLVFEMQEPFMLEEREYFVTASVGMSLYPHDGTTAETLLKSSDMAMYHAKEQGRNACYVFTPSMNQQAVDRLTLETNLHKAVENNEFVLHYQPQVDTVTGAILGMEALIRWQHPEQGMISPGEFIPIAEETGLIVPIGRWALQTACAQTRAWQEAGWPDLRISVNLSLRQLQDASLMTDIQRLLRETGLEAAKLDLEVTESIAMENVQSTIALMQSLRHHGVTFSLDDFGTGYSSLNYLRELPIDTLKIDRAFIRKITQDSRDVALTANIIGMAHALGLKVVAEGIETQEQRTQLQAMGCDICQGYLFSRPLSAEDFTRLLDAGACLGEPLRKAA